MLNKSLLVFALFFAAFHSFVFSQPAERRISREEYINAYKDDAIKEMLVSGVPASITLSQGILESGDGNSPLARYANNHFGIKCHSDWKGKTFYQDDDAKNECFRKYNSVYESFSDHSQFLKTRSRYAFLFELKRTDYKGWAHGLKKAGYATNPKYADLLIGIIENNKLYEYDKVEKMPSLARKTERGKTTSIQKIKRDVKVHDNNIKYLIVKKGDSFFKIAKEMEMGLWQIYKYNDLSKNDELHEGDIIYLQPKRRKAKVEFHIVSKDEDMRMVSQKYGIKLKQLYKLNNMTRDQIPQEGQKLYLRKKANP